MSEAGGDLGSGAPGRENCELLSRCSRKSKEASVMSVQWGRREQVPLDLTGHGQEWGLYSACDGKPGEG